MRFLNNLENFQNFIKNNCENTYEQHVSIDFYNLKNLIKNAYRNLVPILFISYKTFFSLNVSLECLKVALLISATRTTPPKKPKSRKEIPLFVKISSFVYFFVCAMVIVIVARYPEFNVRFLSANRDSPRFPLQSL